MENLPVRIAIALLVIAITACSVPGQKDLHIETGSIGTQFRTSQMERIFSELDYRQETLRSPVTGVVDERVDEGPWIILLFSSKEVTTVRSKVWINRETGLIKMYFREDGSRKLGPEALELYKKLKDRMNLEFGADQVKEL